MQLFVKNFIKKFLQLWNFMKNLENCIKGKNSSTLEKLINILGQCCEFLEKFIRIFRKICRKLLNI